MNYSKFQKFVSEPRLNRFIYACGNSPIKAQKLYSINLKVAQAAYPILSLFETFLRNSINEQLGLFFGDNDWIINQKYGFMSDQSLRPSCYHIRECVLKAERTIVQKGNVVTAGKVIAEQTFGFWTSLFETHHYRLVGGSPIKCFANKPLNVNRSAIIGSLNSVRVFRNRVYHNEPICFVGSSLDFSRAKQSVKQIYDLTSWIDPELQTYMQTYDFLDQKIEAANYI